MVVCARSRSRCDPEPAFGMTDRPESGDLARAFLFRCTVDSTSRMHLAALATLDCTWASLLEVRGWRPSSDHHGVSSAARSCAVKSSR